MDVYSNMPYSKVMFKNLGSVRFFDSLQKPLMLTEAAFIWLKIQ